MLATWLSKAARKVRMVIGGGPDDRFPGSRNYWEDRYRSGGNSGAGSYGRLAVFKADFLNSFVQKCHVHTVLELGCGDGHQLSLAKYEKYVGIDVSASAIQLCRQRFDADRSKSFFHYNTDQLADDSLASDLTLSLDVIYHLVEDDAYESYMTNLFRLARRYVIVYSSDEDRMAPDSHVRHRRCTAWVTANLPEWTLVQKFPNPYPFDASNPTETSFADFFVFEREITQGNESPE